MVVRHCSFTLLFVCVTLSILLFNMVQRIGNIIKDYQDRVREVSYVPTTSFRQDSLRYPGDANKLFLTFLFSDRNIGIQYVGLVRSKVQCNSCGRPVLPREAAASRYSCTRAQSSVASLLPPCYLLRVRTSPIYLSVLNVKARCRGDILQAGKLGSQVGYRVSLYCC